MEAPFVKNLREKLNKNLPGLEAQKKMAHPQRLILIDPPSDAKIAAVLLILVKTKRTWHVVFVERVGRKGDVHSNQIAFPGGKSEIFDSSLLDTALRETFEEIGIAKEKIEVLGSLSPLYISVSNFLMHPFIGVVEEEHLTFSLQTQEIKNAFVFPINTLKKPGTVKLTDIRINEKLTLNDIPYYDVHGKVLWGATAMVISEFLSIMK